MAMLTERHIARLSLISALLIVTLLVVSMGYISISRYHKEFEIRSSIFEEDYFNLTKEKIKASVEIQVYQVESKNARTADEIRQALVRNVTNIYNKIGKDRDLKKLSSVTLRRYLDFYFILDTKGTLIINSEPEGLKQGKNYFSVKNSRGENFVKKIIEIANKEGFGFYQYYWKKPSRNDDYPRLVYIKKLMHSDWILVGGVYSDEIDDGIKDKMLERMNSISGLFENDTYLFVYEMKKSKEGRDYFEILVHPDENLIGKKFSVETVTQEEKNLLEKLTSDLKKHTDGMFVKHSDFRPNTKKLSAKISFFKLYPRWNWIFGRGFYVEDLEKIISNQKLKFQKDIAKDIRSFVILSFVFMALSVIVSIIFSRAIHKIIIDYKDKVTRQNSELRKRERELIKLNKILDETGRRDPLTNLSNRRDMDERLRHYQALFQRTKRSFSIIMADIDYFKSINDAYGHDMGDFILVWISQFLKENVRAQDVVSRWGGEEFLLLLAETELEGALTLAEKIREKIAKTPIIRKDTRLNVTLTLGVSVYDKTADVDEVIKRADDALYRGKKNGRNQVVSEAS